MHLEKGLVVELEGNRILVQSDAEDMCVSCTLNKTCMQGDDKRKRLLWIDNTENASEGDVVEFMIKESSVVLSSLLLYLMPVVMLIGGAVVGMEIELFNLESDISAAIGGFSGLVLSFLGIKIISSYFMKKKKFHPSLVKIIQKCS